MDARSIEIRPLSPDLLSDFLLFFDGDAFADNPRWASCYCQFMYVDHSTVKWKTRTLDQNRAAACDRICANRMQGYLAYRHGKPVGWCNAAPRTMMDALADEPDPDAGRIGRIGCFVVARDHRRTGVATALLHAACDGFEARGLEIVEASPIAAPLDDAEAHLGALSMYLAAGFRIHRTRDDGVVEVRRSPA
jgi:GNAT superfamily N-acetyltransferase